MKFTTTARGAPALILRYLVKQKSACKWQLLLTEAVEDQGQQKMVYY